MMNTFIVNTVLCSTLFLPIFKDNFETAYCQDKNLIKRPVLWGEFYDESTASQKTKDNFITFAHIRKGLKLPLTSRLSIESYILLRYGKDLNRDFWNNRFEAGLGLRIRFSHKIFLAWYTELIAGRYLKIPDEFPQAAKAAYGDFRSGLIFWYGWDKYYEPAKWLVMPLIPWGEVYSDISYFKKERGNIIGYCHFRPGIHVLRAWKSAIDVYGEIYANRDTKRDFWNNKIELGPGLWIKPLPDLELKFYIEWLKGYYMGIEGPDPNPYSQKYNDRRVGILFWIGW